MNRATVIQDAVDLARRHAQPVVVFEYGDECSYGELKGCDPQEWEEIRYRIEGSVDFAEAVKQARR